MRKLFSRKNREFNPVKEFNKIPMPSNEHHIMLMMNGFIPTIIKIKTKLKLIRL